MSRMKDEAIRLENLKANRPPCPFCGGTRKVVIDRPGPHQGDMEPCRNCDDGKMDICAVCDGTLLHPVSRLTCYRCKGTGYYSPNYPIPRKDEGEYCAVPWGLRVVLWIIAAFWAWACWEIAHAIWGW